tara:strand:- start:405 stop:806 length:402 start_codon:yes stop_codon:yes gene_type:complete
MLEVTVLGIPQPQGSKTVYSGRAVDANAKKLKPWRREVTATVRKNVRDWQLTPDPIKLTVRFLMPRPKTVTRAHHTVKPDLDKLVRAICDGITDAGVVWVDDSQVVQIRATKAYANDLPAQVQITVQNALLED